MARRIIARSGDDAKARPIGRFAFPLQPGLDFRAGLRDAGPVPSTRGGGKQGGRGLSDSAGVGAKPKAIDPARAVQRKRKGDRTAAGGRPRRAAQGQAIIPRKQRQAGGGGQHFGRVQAGSGRQAYFFFRSFASSARTASLRRAAIMVTSASLLALTKG